MKFVQLRYKNKLEFVDSSTFGYFFSQEEQVEDGF